MLCSYIYYIMYETESINAPICKDLAHLFGEGAKPTPSDKGTT